MATYSAKLLEWGPYDPSKREGNWIPPRFWRRLIGYLERMVRKGLKIRLDEAIQRWHRNKVGGELSERSIRYYMATVKASAPGLIVVLDKVQVNGTWTRANFVTAKRSRASCAAPCNPFYICRSESRVTHRGIRPRSRASQRNSAATRPPNRKNTKLPALRRLAYSVMHGRVTPRWTGERYEPPNDPEWVTLKSLHGIGCKVAYRPKYAYNYVWKALRAGLMVDDIVKAYERALRKFEQIASANHATSQKPYEPSGVICDAMRDLRAILEGKPLESTETNDVTQKESAIDWDTVPISNEQRTALREFFTDTAMFNTTQTRQAAAILAIEKFIGRLPFTFREWLREENLLLPEKDSKTNDKAPDAAAGS